MKINNPLGAWVQRNLRPPIPESTFREQVVNAIYLGWNGDDIKTARNSPDYMNEVAARSLADRVLNVFDARAFELQTMLAELCDKTFESGLTADNTETWLKARRLLSKFTLP